MKWLELVGTSIGPSFAASEQALHDAAIRIAGGWDDFGEPSYLEGLRRLLDSYDNEARFHPAGRLTAAYQVVGLLAERLRTQQWLEIKPEVLDQSIERPLVITGMVRTGSTALHYLMGANPEMQCLQYWTALHPQPRPPRHSWTANRDFQHAQVELSMMYAAGKKQLEGIHHMTADGPDESGRILGQGFSDDRFEVVSTVPSYAEWYASTIHRGTYARHKQVIQLIGFYEPERRWLLKYPVHIRNLEAFLETYPDACIIWTHRDPARVLASYVSLCAHFRSLFEVTPDRPRIAREQCDAWARALNRAVELRRGRARQFHDVYFEDFRRDPIGEVARAYERYEQPFGGRARRALERWREAHPPGAHGAHVYDREGFGLSREAIHERFAPYLAAFPRVLDEGRQQ